MRKESTLRPWLQVSWEGGEGHTRTGILLSVNGTRARVFIGTDSQQAKIVRTSHAHDLTPAKNRIVSKKVRALIESYPLSSR